jgi:hypothetical protein
VIFYFYVVPDLLDFTVGIDQESTADDALVRVTHEFLHAPRAVGFDHFVVGIAEEREIQFLLGAKFGQGFFRVGAGAQNQDADFVEVFLCVAKLGRFGRSTGGVGFGKEEEDDAPAAEIGKRERCAFVGL